MEPAEAAYWTAYRQWLRCGGRSPIAPLGAGAKVDAWLDLMRCARELEPEVWRRVRGGALGRRGSVDRLATLLEGRPQREREA